jgi:hypothetical protein
MERVRDQKAKLVERKEGVVMHPSGFSADNLGTQSENPRKLLKFQG